MKSRFIKGKKSNNLFLDKFDKFCIWKLDSTLILSFHFPDIKKFGIAWFIKSHELVKKSIKFQVSIEQFGSMNIRSAILVLLELSVIVELKKKNTGAFDQSCPKDIKLVKLTDAEKFVITDYHNYYRAKISFGDLETFPVVFFVILVSNNLKVFLLREATKNFHQHDGWCSLWVKILLFPFIIAKIYQNKFTAIQRRTSDHCRSALKNLQISWRMQKYL